MWWFFRINSFTQENRIHRRHIHSPLPKKATGVVIHATAAPSFSSSKRRSSQPSSPNLDPPAADLGRPSAPIKSEPSHPQSSLSPPKSHWRVLTIPRGLETFQPPGPGADTCPIWTPNPAACCNGAKMCRSEQNICVIVAKIVFT
jgi:hypothetical protein